VRPRRVPNAELRTREYLTEAEVERLIKAAKANRHGQRCHDDLAGVQAWATGGGDCRSKVGSGGLGPQRVLHVRRVKNGMPSVHPLQGDEMRALRELKRSADSPFVFTSERGTPFTRAGFAKMLARLGKEAGFKFGVHPHMLRHACGYALANRGHDTRALQAYLGHKNIQHTVRYTELSPTRFKDFWRT
jgi:integrase